MRNIMTVLLVMTGVALVAFYFLVRHLEANGVFYPGKELRVYPSAMQLPYDDVFMPTSDGLKINAWFIKNPKAASTIIFASPAVMPRILSDSECALIRQFFAYFRLNPYL